jgi:hypothetical protein
MEGLNESIDFIKTNSPSIENVNTSSDNISFEDLGK